MRIVERTEDEISEVEERCMVLMSSGQSEYAGMSYEEGIDAAFRWLFDKDSDPPFDEE